MRVDLAVLRKVAEVILEFFGKCKFAGEGFEEAKKGFYKGGFAGAVGTDDAEEVTLVNFKVEFLGDGGGVGIADGEILSLNEGEWRFSWHRAPP